MKTTFSTLAICLIAACTSPPKSPTLPAIESVLGKNWVCYTVPDGLKKAGVVIEVAEDGVYYFHSDFSGHSIEAASLIGKNSYESYASIEILAKLMRSIGIVDAGSELSASVKSQPAKVSITYHGTRKHVISGDQVDTIRDIYARKPLNPHSNYFVYRESHSATSLEMALERSTAATILAELDLGDSADIGADLKAGANDLYESSGSFNEPIGICTLAYPVKAASRGTDGTFTMEIGDLPVSTSPDAPIVIR